MTESQNSSVKTSSRQVDVSSGLTHCELAGQLAALVSGVQGHVLFWSEDQQAFLGGGGGGRREREKG